jgi:hypothetical protein
MQRACAPFTHTASRRWCTRASTDVRYGFDDDDVTMEWTSPNTRPCEHASAMVSIVTMDERTTNARTPSHHSVQACNRHASSTDR